MAVGAYGAVVAWELVKQLHHEGEMVLGFFDVFILIFFGVEQELAGEHLEKEAGKGPHIRSVIIVDAQDHFWASVLPGLYLGLEVVVDPASIPQVRDLYHEILTQLAFFKQNLVDGLCLLVWDASLDLLEILFLNEVLGELGDLPSLVFGSLAMFLHFLFQFFL